ncbi:response regulator [Dulcicalothrix desertica PCC 7102]|uniref:Response regulator n=2 Tax=Dulcicalothrix desertica TaxID=32056 RepID=A0A3S1A9S7_9CYAN|nr:response regulator [Dulcicalothrix desertica PCC 7102]TWH40398.1 Response regulators consisting of a CheY-like receiver domain and a winged-helix DNA-binding domain [Dulcicalothrix desertica PCC 7102]BDA66416.1 response regulator receiver protein [Calothrix sp. PCC 7716]GJD20290.1 response regulator receiver protein [Rivularia sp. IAM M-261]
MEIKERSMELKRILLVEDSINDVELILTSLAENHLGNEVVVVRDGEEALDYLYRRGMYRLRREGNPVVVLLDLKLPKVDGIEVLSELKANNSLRTVPVVVLTSSREEHDLARCYELGTNAYVVKPIDFHEFVDVIKGLGLFWAIINEPPPGSIPPARSNAQGIR